MARRTPGRPRPAWGSFRTSGQQQHLSRVFALLVFSLRPATNTLVEGRRVEVNPATPKVMTRSQPLVSALQRQEDFLEAQTKLARAQLAVLQMHHRIMFPQVDIVSRILYLTFCVKDPNADCWLPLTLSFQVYNSGWPPAMATDVGPQARDYSTSSSNFV